MSLSTQPKQAATAGSSFAKLLRVAVKFLLICIFVAAGFFIGGFFQFSNKVTSYEQPDDVEVVQGIVVLTGGSARIAKALDLMKAQKGKRLLISGVNKGTTKDDLEELNSHHSQTFECCVDIEKAAQDTIGNAVETKKWMDANSYKTMIMVTSAYHMPRSLMEFRRQMEDTKIVPYPVTLDVLTREGWWKNSETLRFMMSEYLKYVGAWIRPMFKPKTLNAIRGSMFGQ